MANIITVDGMEFNDDLTSFAALKNLWQTVALEAVQDAVRGCRSGYAPNRERDNEAARNYIITPNADFNLLCAYADLDADAVRGRVSKMVENAPSPAALAARKRGIGRPPGVPLDFDASEGTGAGSTLQETSNITFSEEAENA